jgi:hypothetical protein
MLIQQSGDKTMPDRKANTRKLLRYTLLTTVAAIYSVAYSWAEDRPLRGNALMDTVVEAESVAVGKVTDVNESGGHQQARIHVTDTIRGRLPATIAVLGSSKDPELAHFSAGEQVLLLLKNADMTGNYQTVKGSAGKFNFNADQKELVVDFASEYTKGLNNETEHYQHIKQWIDKGRLPPEVQANLLWELESRYAHIADSQWTSRLLHTKSSSPMVQRWALRQVGRHRMYDLKSTVSDVAESGHRTVRAQAVQTLGELGDATEVDELTKHLNDKSRGVRQSAVEALMRKKSPEAASALLKHYSNEQSSLVRVAIIESLQKLPQGEQMLHRLEREHPDRTLRMMRGRAGEGATGPGGEDPEEPVTANDPEEHPRQGQTTQAKSRGE